MTVKIRIAILVAILFARHDLMSQNQVMSNQHFANSDKVIITTKIYGLLDNYEPQSFHGSIDLKSHFIKLYPQFQQVSDSLSFHHYLTELLGPFNRSTAPRGSAIPMKADPARHPIVADFDWIEDVRIPNAIRYQLYDILSAYKPDKRKEKSIKGRYRIEHVTDYPADADSVAMFSLGMIKFWNDVFYYFPYKNLMDESWSDVLVMEADRMIAARTITEYVENLRILAAYMDDSHVYVSFDKYQVWAYGFYTWMTYPLAPKILNDTVYVKGVAKREYLSEIHPGDVITHINGVDIRSYLEQKAVTICASNKYDSIQKLEWKILPAYNHPDLGDSVITVTIKGKTHSLYAEPLREENFSEFMSFPERKKLSSGSEINERTGYIRLTENKGRDIHKGFKSLADKQNLILDLRGYPKTSLIKYIARNLSRKAAPVASFYYPEYDYPGYFIDYKKNITYYISNNFDYFLLAFSQSKGKLFPTTRKPFSGRLLVLIDEQAISFSETIGMILRAYRPDAVFVGRPSNGANGDVAVIKLPYTISVSMSGLHWHFSDGSQLQRVGLQPDYLVERSYDELLNNEDKILEKALELIETTKVSKSNTP
jgi:C-terminal processing protease CtpA/Prc